MFITNSIKHIFKKENTLYRFNLLFFVLFLIGCDSEFSPPPVVDPNDDVETPSEYILVITTKKTDGVFLMNKEGKKLFEWQIDRQVGNDANLLDNGSLLVALKDENAQVPFIAFGGSGGKIRLINSNQETDWEITYSSENHIQHHDVEYLSNGNIMFLIWEKFDGSEAGFKQDIPIYTEAIIEMNPLTEEIVWEWHAIDHLIQDFDSSKDKFGVVADNPNKIDVNYEENHPNNNGDIMHANGITIDEEKKLIYMTVNFYSEVWVIDYSTTSSEAATSTGGNYGLGGDLVYRFGNPSAYDNSSGERTLNRVHYPNLLDNGNILLYANQIDTEQSEVIEFEMPASYTLSPNANNEPIITWNFTDSNLYSDILSSAVRFSSGNTLITEGRQRTLWEVDNTGNIVWTYIFEEEEDPFLVWRAYTFLSNDSSIEALSL